MSPDAKDFLLSFLFPLAALVAACFVVAHVAGCTNMAPNYNRCRYMQCGPVDAGPDAGCIDDDAGVDDLDADGGSNV